MSASELLASEARRLFELWMAKSAEYYAANSTDETPILEQSSAAEYAASVVIMVRSCVMTSEYGTAEGRMRDALSRETNRLVAEHLDDVLAKLLVSSSHATTNACDGSSSA